MEELKKPISVRKPFSSLTNLMFKLRKSYRLMENELKTLNTENKAKVLATTYFSHKSFDSAKRFALIKIRAFSKEPAFLFTLKQEFETMASTQRAAELFKEIGIPFEQALNAGFKLKELFNAGYSFNEIKKLVPLSDLRAIEGFTLEDFAKAKQSLETIRKAGFTLNDLKNASEEIKEALDIRLTTLKKAGYTAKEFHEAGFKIYEDLIKVYGFKELINGGYNKAEDIKEMIEFELKKINPDPKAVPEEKRKKIGLEFVNYLRKAGFKEEAALETVAKALEAFKVRTTTSVPQKK